MQMLRLFDQLIANTDRNLGNLLIGNDWTIWAIDHTRAFRTHATLKTPGNVTRCDREVFARLKQLDKPTLSKAVGNSLQGYEIESVLKRRDAIVTIIEQRGESRALRPHQVETPPDARSRRFVPPVRPVVSSRRPRRAPARAAPACRVRGPPAMLLSCS